MEINEPVDAKKKLNIIAIADTSEFGKTAVCYGGMLAVIFKASLTIVSKFDFSYEEPKTEGNPDNIIQYIQQFVNHDLETILLIDYFFPEKIYHYAEETNTIMFVIGVDTVGKESFFNKRKAIKFIRPSRLPVMTVGKTLPEKNIFQHVVLPLDLERQGKEKALWAGYFSRFYNSVIHVLYPHYTDKSLQKQIHDNITFVEKLYANLEVKYQLDEIDAVKDIDLYSITYASKVNATLTVIMMTKYFTPADFFTGPREKKLIGNPQNFPVLCINERDDLYVLCT